MDNYLYKTRVSLFNLDIIFLFILTILAFFVRVWLGLLALLFLIFWIISIVSMRFYIYKDRIEYKSGLFLKTFQKSIPISKVCSITYNSDILGKIFKYGDITIGTYNDLDGFRLKGVKNAKMLSENIKKLMDESK